jgi:hypothetical protein
VSVPVKYLKRFEKLLKEKGISIKIRGNETFFFHSLKEILFKIPAHLIVRSPGKVVAVIQSRLGLNKRIFARNCEVRKIDRPTAEDFLDQFHLMNSTQSAYNYGLFLKTELIAVASFSKGRKMDRLPSGKRSFELIRFCTKEGITITGGLTKLLKFFCREKDPGDIMTYVDKQFSFGGSLIKIGFVKLGETPANYFLQDKQTFERILYKDPDEPYDRAKYVLEKNEGNFKFVYTP